MSEGNAEGNPKRGDSSGQGESEGKKEPREVFACAKEAGDLLNCVAGKNYNELKCVNLIKKLRECVKKKGVVSFSLLPDEASPPPQSTQPKSHPAPTDPPPAAKEPIDKTASGSSPPSPSP